MPEIHTHTRARTQLFLIWLLRNIEDSTCVYFKKKRKERKRKFYDFIMKMCSQASQSCYSISLVSIPLSFDHHSMTHEKLIFIHLLGNTITSVTNRIESQEIRRGSK